MKMTYEVIEDNGGGLHLFISDLNGAVIYAHNGYEYTPEDLTADLAELRSGSDPLEWDGNADDPQAARDDLDRFDHGWAIIADETSIYRGRMGAAGAVAFGE